MASQLRSRAYLRLLLLAAVLGVVISAFAYFFLAAADQLQRWLYHRLPSQLGFDGVPAWWPIPLLLIGGIFVAVFIKFLPGNGGHEPADGFKAGGVTPAPELPGVFLASLATLGFGAVLGPEAPLIALGGGVAVWAIGRAAKGDKSVTTVVAASGSFAAISTLLGNPLIGAFLLMESTPVSAAVLELVLLPGLLASGVGALLFVGLNSWTGLGTFSLGIPGLPHFARPDIGEFGWAVAIGLIAAVIGALIRGFALWIRPQAKRWILIGTPLAGLLIAGLAITFQQVTGHTTADVLFSGQSQVNPLVAQRAAYGVAALLLMLACKGLAYSLSLATFRGGPIFPGIFIGAAGGLLLAHLPGLPVAPAMGIGIAAMMTAMLRLPMTSALLAAFLLESDFVAVTPLVIVAAVVSFVASAHLDRLGAKGAAQGDQPQPTGQAQQAARRALALR